MYVDVQEMIFLFVIRDLYTFVNCQVTISCHTTQIFCCFYIFIYVPLENALLKVNVSEKTGICTQTILMQTLSKLIISIKIPKGI